MIKEDYCSFEIAKLLKEKGFNVPTHAFYNPKKNYTLKFDTCLIDRNAGIYVSAPTHQMAMTWLRMKHNILLFLLPSQENGKLVYLVEVWTCNKEENIYESTYASIPRKEPKQSIETALKYTLENLI